MPTVVDKRLATLAQALATDLQECATRRELVAWAKYYLRAGYIWLADIPGQPEAVQVDVADDLSEPDRSAAFGVTAQLRPLLQDYLEAQDLPRPRTTEQLLELLEAL